MRRILLYLLALALTFALCSCTMEQKIIGKWNFEAADTDSRAAASLSVSSLVFSPDGELSVEKWTESGVIYVEEYRYSVTSDTLTVNMGEVSTGVPIQIRGNRLLVGSGPAGEAVFKRAK